VPKVPQALRNALLLEASERVGMRPPARADAGADRTELSYAWLFDAAMEAVLVVEEVSGKIVEANLAAARLLHAERASVIGKSLLSLFHASSAAALKESLAQARSGSGACSRALATPDRRHELKLTMSVFHGEAADSYMLVRLVDSHATAQKAAPGSAVFEAIEGAVPSRAPSQAFWSPIRACGCNMPTPPSRG
jgi:PAS domain-containing protein